MNIEVERGEGICDNCEKVRNLIYLIHSTGPGIGVCVECVKLLISSAGGEDMNESREQKLVLKREQ